MEIKKGQQEITKFFSSPARIQQLVGILERAKAASHAEKFEELLQQVVSGDTPRFLMTGELIDRCGIPETQAGHIFYEVLELIDPVVEYFGSGVHLPSLNLASHVQGLHDAEKAVHAFLEEVRASAGIVVREDVLDRRFRALVFNWIRDVRDDMETRETAIRETRVGGLGLSADSAAKLIESLRSVRDRYIAQGKDPQRIISEYLKQQEKLFTKQVAEDIEIDVKSGEGKRGGAKTQETNRDEVARSISATKHLLESHTELEPPHLMVRDDRAQNTTGKAVYPVQHEKPILKPGNNRTTQKHIKPLTSHEQIQAPSTTPIPHHVVDMVQSAAKQIPPSIRKETTSAGSMSSSDGVKGSSVANNDIETNTKPTDVFRGESVRRGSIRPRVADVKAPPKLYGPIDELASLTVTDFRRLATDPTEAIRKILHKIHLLEEESMHKRAEGIRALKSSPLYVSYAKVLMQGVTTGASFAQAVTASGDITAAEVRAILELNKQLGV